MIYYQCYSDNNIQLYASFLRIFHLFYQFLHAICLNCNKDLTKKFRLRFINQQTADCTQSDLLEALELSPKVFPIQVKMKGSNRLLLKIKLMSILPNNIQLLVGEGVVNIDSKLFENSLRVPIYDKKQGVEEVAVCSIDIYITGFSIQKNSFSYNNKSQSKINDQRDASEDAVFSQMSYTIEQQSERSEKQQPKHANKQFIKKNGISPNIITSKQKQAINDKFSHQIQANINSRNIDNLSKSKYLEELTKKQRKINEQQQQPQSQYDEKNQNSIYLKEGKGQINKKDKNVVSPKQRQKTNRQIQSQKIKQNQLLDSSESYLKSDYNIFKKDDENIKIEVKQDEKILARLKSLMKKQDNQSQLQSVMSNERNRIKLRRKKIKIQALQSYKYHSTFIKYYINIDNKPVVLLHKLKAIRIIQNQSKQSQQQLVEQPINKLVISTMQNEKILSFDALGYRSYCISNGIKQNSIGIHIPFDELSLKMTVHLNDEGFFEGILGLQEGQGMGIRLFRINQPEKRLTIAKDTFKLYCDIKPLYNHAKYQSKSNRLDKTLIQNNQQFIAKLSIKQRIQTLSVHQPWGYLSDPIKKNTQKLQLNNLQQIARNQPIVPKLIIQRQKSRLSNLSLDRSNKQKQKQSKVNKYLINKSSPKNKTSQNHRYVTSDDYQRQSYDQFDKQFQKSKDFNRGNSRYNDNQIDNSQINQINNIRNGNRNNYKFKKREEKNIKSLWQELLIKNKVQQQNKLKRQLDLHRKKVNNSMLHKKNSISSSLYSSVKPHYNQPINQPKALKILSPIKAEQAHQKYQRQDLLRDVQYPFTSLRLQINNISITESRLLIDEDIQSETGKFIKISIQKKVDYYTEVIFNGQWNSILWKLQGCFFKQLCGDEKLQIQIYATLNNAIKVMGRAVIRLKKLIFLRNNHIYNGKILYQDNLKGQFTLCFNLFEDIPFEIVQEDSQNDRTEYGRYNNLQRSKGTRHNKKIRYKKEYQLPNRLNNLQMKKTINSINTIRKNNNSRIIRSNIYGQSNILKIYNKKGRQHKPENSEGYQEIG